MKVPSIIAGLLACACLHASAAAGDGKRIFRPDQAGPALERNFFYRLDLRASGAQAEALLRRDPANPAALFVRMEAAELEDRADLVLDSALRLCRVNAPADFQEVASHRVLEHAGNTEAFNAVVRRGMVQAAARSGVCAFNLRLALVAAATDGAPALDLDQAASAAGLATHWRIAGPFGRYSNVDFERHWPPEWDHLALSAYGALATEDFWFRDGKITLPDYLSGPGVFYAATETRTSRGADFRLEVLAAGPYVVFVDGRPALLHDSPYIATAGHDSVSLRLQPGRHKIMLKFTAEGAPLRLALHAGPATPSSSSSGGAVVRQPLHEYASALLSYFREDFAGLERRLGSRSCARASACIYLHALLQSPAAKNSAQPATLWESLAKSEPQALLAWLNARTTNASPGQDAGDARKLALMMAQQHPQSERALQLAFDLSRGDPAAGGKLLLRLLELHPSCTRRAQALEFYNLAGDLDQARLAEERMDGCAPGSLDYARALSDTGRHSAAAAALQQVIAVNPLDRAARSILVEELMLAGKTDRARQEAEELRRIAPNAARFLRLAEDPALALDGKNPRAQGFARNQEFYVPYRRDGLELIRDSAQPEPAGGSAAVLLADQVIELRRDGSISVYVHRIRRLLNKEGISSYGEVTVPQGANILELRTVKSSGQIVEPELGFDTGSISMPALDPGDCIEEEFVSHYSAWDQAPQDVFRFEFGSFVAPVLASRLVAIVPAGSGISFFGQNGAPSPRIEQAQANVIQIWKRDNIAPTTAESFLPGSSLLPTVTVSRAEQVRDRLRDQLEGSTRLGPRAMDALQGLHLPPTAGERARAKSLYSFVKQTIEPDGSDWTANSADDTLAASRGSRTLALLALARVAGLRAGLVLARGIDHTCSENPDLHCYSEPLVRFWIGHEAADADAESDDLPFGVVPPSLASSDALLLPLAAAPDQSTTEAKMVGLATDQALEKTVAEGDLWLNEQGDLTARVHVRLGATRAQELRSRLRGDLRERQAFYEQFARRILPDSVDVTGSVAHEHDPEQPLELTLRCRVPQFADLKTGAADIGQLAPALGLRGTYARAATRRFPLYTESLFFENTIFRLHLPPEIEVRSLPADFSARSEFGDYLVHFAHTGPQIEIRREFRIPVQLIAPDKYPAFDAFARQIDDAERQRISLEPAHYASTVPASSKLPPLPRR